MGLAHVHASGGGSLRTKNSPENNCNDTADGCSGKRNPRSPPLGGKYNPDTNRCADEEKCPANQEEDQAYRSQFFPMSWLFSLFNTEWRDSLAPLLLSSLSFFLLSALLLA